MMTDWAFIDTLRIIVFLSAVMVVWCVTGRLRLANVLRPGDSRKINHIIAFAGGSFLFGWLPHEKAILSGAIAGTILILSVFVVCTFSKYAPFSWAFAGNTRPSDAPNQAFYFWSSWFLSVIGLMAIEAVLQDPGITRLAAIVVGIGDGIAEPIGTRFGKHIYKITGFWTDKPLTRSVEGSIAVSLGTFLSLIAVTYFEAGFEWTRALITAGSVAAGTTIVEAITPHGFDNLTIAITVAGLLVSFNYLF